MSEKSQLSSAQPAIGVVVIGRNEGSRLIACLDSLVAAEEVSGIVYVDSNSSDGSVQRAEERGVAVLSLDLSRKFTAARARNAGLWALLEKFPDTAFVQFVDGDCEVVSTWWATARDALTQDEQLAVVCGRRRERFPEFSLYNRLCDLEWNTPVGDARSCGGDALFRVEALRKVQGYRESLIAGEEPEMCYRMRQLNYRVKRLGVEMTLHDANISRPSQWFKRVKRSGHAYAEQAALHGKGGERFGMKQTLSNLFWGAAIPGALGVTVVTAGPVLATLGGALSYGYLYRKSYRHERNRPGGARSESDARLMAASCVVGKLPSALGAVEYWTNRIRGQQSKIIEYK